LNFLTLELWKKKNSVVNFYENILKLQYFLGKKDLKIKINKNNETKHQRMLHVVKI